MSEVAENQMTVLVSSHNLRELEDVCDHVGIMHQGTIMIERSLSDLQGSVSKIQVACQNGVPKLSEEFEVLHMSNTGRVYTLLSLIHICSLSGRKQCRTYRSDR